MHLIELKILQASEDESDELFSDLGIDPGDEEPIWMTGTINLDLVSGFFPATDEGGGTIIEISGNEYVVQPNYEQVKAMIRSAMDK